MNCCIRKFTFAHTFKNLYGVSVVFLAQISDYLQWFLWQLVALESLMVSVERTFQITELNPEKELTTNYDHQL